MAHKGRNRRRGRPVTRPESAPAKRSPARTPAKVRARTVAASPSWLPPAGIFRREAPATIGIGLAAAGLFAATFSPHVALGDAPESVAGVRELGVLHAPGYPAYELAARGFASVVAVGSFTFRVNLFSLVCAALTVAAVYLLARCLGAGRVGAMIGAFALAASESFWFNAGFAKHYAFSGLMVTASMLLVVAWQAGGRTVLLVVAGALLGAGLGSAWQLAAIAIAGLVLLILFGPRRARRRAIVFAGGAMFFVGLASWSFVLVRARQDPTLNWGDATNLPRLLALISQRDFTLAPTSANLPTRAGGTIGSMVRDFGLGAIALAVVGAVGAARRLGRAPLVFLGVVGLVNLVAVAVFSAVPIQGFGSTQVQGGYLIDAMVVVAVLTALGATYAIHEGAQQIRSLRAPLATFAFPVVAVAVASVTIVPSVVVHFRYADLRGPSFADDYAHQVLTELPPHAALLVWGEEFSFPFLYRQVVDHERTDVTVIAANAVNLQWARVQLTRRLDLGTALQPAPLVTSIQDLIATLRKSRPVFLDASAMETLREFVGYRDRGLVAEVVDGAGPQPIDDPAAVSALLEQSDARGGLIGRPSNRYPYRTVFFLHHRAHIELAKVYALRHDFADAEREMRLAVDLFPSEQTAAETLAGLEQPGGKNDLGLVLNM